VESQDITDQRPYPYHYQVKREWYNAFKLNLRIGAAMYEIESQTVTEGYKQSNVPVRRWTFQINNGNTGETNISDPLLDTEERAAERAKSEFLKNSYSLHEVRFKTYITNLKLNQIVRIKGVPYIVKNIDITVDNQHKADVRAVRYE
jgi:hypothetical protein